MVPNSVLSDLRVAALHALGNEDEAEEVVQECMARAVEALCADRIPKDVPVGAYVYGIARHVIVDQLRRRSRHCRLVDPDLLTSPDPSPLELTARNEEIDQTRHALAALPPDDREILERCFLRGERVVDIARTEGQPQERIRKRKSRALSRLRAIMERIRADRRPSASASPWRMDATRGH